jgi:general secretion pathway protein M
MIRAFWDKLDQKQRYIVAAGATFVAIALLLELMIFPFRDAKNLAKKTIQIQEKKLVEITMLDAEFSRQEGKILKIKNVLATRTVDFSLFSYLEKKATQAGVRGNVRYMNSSRGMTSALFEETIIDMRMDKITIKQLSDFLYYAESPSDLVKIKRLSVNKMKENPEYLSAQLQLSSLQPHQQRQGGK